jgi:cytochrome P450
MQQGSLEPVVGQRPAGGLADAARSIADLPAPIGLPVLGNAHQVRPSTLHRVAEGWCADYGPIFRFRLGRRSVVCIGDLDTINAILRDRPNGFRRWRELEDGVGFPGVFVAEGEEWRRQRRLVVTALNSNHLHRYFHVVRRSTERLHGQLRELAHFRRSFDIGRELTSYAVDITSALAFGRDLNTLERRNNRLQKHIQRVMAINGRRLSMPLPYWHWFSLPADRAARRSLVAIRHAVERFIEDASARLAERPELHEAPENFLEGMLAAQKADGAFSDEEIIGNTFTLLLAGEDTTAHTIAWTIWLLTSRPEVLARCAQEADAVFGAQRLAVEFESVERLRYTEAVLRESMRLRPVAPLLFVEPLADTTIAGTSVPAGTRLALLTRHASRRGGGLDRAGEFDPERWLGDGDDGSQAPDQKSFLAFGAGPRFCPGRNLAFLESKCALAMIARNFEFDLDEAGGAVHERLAFTMIPNGLRVRLRERGDV